MIAIAFGVGLLIAYASVLILIVALGPRRPHGFPPLSSTRIEPPAPQHKPFKTDWDVAQAAEAEPAPPLYMYGVTGLEDV
ncbi:hypothetical protein NDK50_08005 [Paraburkholderia bryophila]|uniref:hypothetical protein n=1 Tax=Paraburkholderia bryophila TaxID=420952 RepID=UPI00234BFD30|nr:hypothetical protein [Paraburkholderia bryophila]WCM21379.1 hypothetical protein NDK50_08005 [Paraburkholderia bryophila]